MAFNMFVIALLTLVPCLQMGQNSALEFSIEPNTFVKGSKATVDIQCQPDSVESKSKEIVLIEIGKDPLTLARLGSGSNITIETDNRQDMKAKGNLVAGAPDATYLKLTLSNVEEDDAGVYTCIIYYRDQNNRLKEDKGHATLHVKRTVQDLTDEVSFLRSEVAVLKTAVISLQNRVTDASSFAVTTVNKVSVSVGDTIILPNLVLKEGGGYDTSTGVFTAPRAGIYVFHLTATMGCGDCELDIDLRVDDNVVERLSSKDTNHADQSSISPVIHLGKAQKVKAVVIHITSGTNDLHGLQYTMFSGFFLRPL